MKRIVFVFIISLLADAYSYAETITITNNSECARMDEAFVVHRADIKYPVFGLVPGVLDSLGNFVPSQVDDLDGDGEWDELAFVCSLKAGSKMSLTIKWVKADQLPLFKQRTHVRLGKMFKPGDIRVLQIDSHGKNNLPRGAGYPYQTDGPAWENDKVGFRHYFDGRNVRDIFGKRVSGMVMDTVGIRQDGTPGDTYHVLADWGRDIMNGASSIGLGGTAILYNNRLIRLGVKQAETTDNVDSTVYRCVADGPVRSVFKLDFYGWDIGGTKIDVTETVTIWAGKYGYENVIRTSPLPQGAKLVTGIVDSLNDCPGFEAVEGGWHIMATHDKQTYNKVWYMGMALLINTDNYLKAFEAPKSGEGITTTWCATLKPDSRGEYRFNCYAGWELSDARFTEADYFFDLMKVYAKELSRPSEIVISSND